MSHFISLDEATKMTAEFRHKRKDLLDPKLKDSDKKVLPTCESFDRSAIEAILKQPDCRGIRIYYGLKNGAEVHAIIVGYDKEDRDILPSTAQERTEGSTEEGEILEKSTRCPDSCPPPSILNS